MYTKWFATFCVVITIVLLFQPIVSAQNEIPRTFEAKFAAQDLGDESEIIPYNLGEPTSIRSEIDNWDDALGLNANSGSYVGPVFEPSLFEIDYEPYRENGVHTTSSIDITSVNYIGDKYPEFFWSAIPYNGVEYIWEDVYTPHAAKRSSLMLSNVMSFSNRMIMSGASETWIKIPVRASCVDFNETRPTISLFRINDTPDNIRTQVGLGMLECLPNYETIYDPNLYIRQTYQEGIIDFNGIYHYPGELYDKKNIPGTIREDLNDGELLEATYKGVRAGIVQPVTEENIIENDIYVKLNGAIEPNNNYLVVFNCVLKDKPRIYITEEDISENGRSTQLTFTDYSMEAYDVNSPSWVPWSTNVDNTATHGASSLIKVQRDATIATTNETISMPIDAGFSFIFKSGRGEYGMLGYKTHFDEGDALVFYNTLDMPSHDQYVSVMLPFACNKPIAVNLTVTLLSPNVKFEPQGVIDDFYYFAGEIAENGTYIYEHDNIFVYINPYIWQANKVMRYGDFILFTVPWKVNADIYTQSDFDVKVMVTFIEEADVTFLLSTLSESDLATTVNDVVPNVMEYNVWPNNHTLALNPYYPRGNLCYIYRNTTILDMNYHGWENEDDFEEHTLISGNPYIIHSYVQQQYITPPILTDSEIVHFELFKSVQLTDGIWHEMATDVNGFQYATHFFERRIAVGYIELYVDTTDDEIVTTSFAQQALELLTSTSAIGFISSLVSSAISGEWNGIDTFLGAIIGQFKKTIDILKGIGNFIYAKLAEFFGPIFSVIGDIWGALEVIFEASLYVIAIIIFMYVITWAGKLLYISRLSI